MYGRVGGDAQSPRSASAPSPAAVQCGIGVGDDEHRSDRSDPIRIVRIVLRLILLNQRSAGCRCRGTPAWRSAAAPDGRGGSALTRAISSRRLSGLIPVARLDLVLLRVEILLRPWPHGHVLTQLEAAVDAVAGRQRRGENQPHLERRPSAVSAGTRGGCPACSAKKFGRMYSCSSVVVSSVRYSRSSCARVAPGEIRVGLREARLREISHHLRPGERLRQEDRVRDARAGCRRCTIPRRGTAWCAGCRRGRCVTPCAIQNRKTSRSAVPQRLPVGALEIERIDVLVFLRRVLRVLDRAVGPMPEPFRMLAHPRMIRRRLERDVERDVAARGARRADEPIEVVERSEARLDGGVAAVASDRSPTGCRDRPAPRVSELLRPFRCVSADWMDRRQIDHVEAHRGDVRQPRFRFAERAAARRIRRARARETSRTTRRTARAQDRRRRRACARRSWLRCGRDARSISARERRIARRPDACDLRPIAAQDVGDFEKAETVGSAGPTALPWSNRGRAGRVLFDPHAAA